MTRRLYRLLTLGIATAAVVISSILFIPSVQATPPPTNKRGKPSDAEGGSEDTARLEAKLKTHWNNWACRTVGPDGQYRRPVVLLHGMFFNGEKNGVLGTMGRYLIQRDLCVFSTTYGTSLNVAGGALKVWGPAVSGINGGGPPGGLAGIYQSAQEVAVFVERVSRLNRGKVDIVAHSEGTVVTRTFLKYFKGSSFVDRVVLLTPVGRGTTLQGIVPLMRGLGLLPLGTTAVQALGHQALVQMVEGSQFMKDLAAGGESLPSVQYLLLLTRYDEASTPPENGLLKNSEGKIVASSPPSLSTGSAGAGAGAGKVSSSRSNVFNQWIQDWCTHDKSGHMDMLTSNLVLASIYQFLNPAAKVEISCQE